MPSTSSGNIPVDTKEKEHRMSRGDKTTQWTSMIALAQRNEEGNSVTGQLAKCEGLITTRKRDAVGSKRKGVSREGEPRVRGEVKIPLYLR